jgi:hypothetical protein
MANAVELLRLGHFLGNASLTCALCCHLALQLESLDEEALLQAILCGFLLLLGCWAAAVALCSCWRCGQAGLPCKRRPAVCFDMPMEAPSCSLPGLPVARWPVKPACPPSLAVLQVFKAAADLKLRQLTTDCLVLLLPQFGRPTADGTGVGARWRLGAAGCLRSCLCLPEAALLQSSSANGPVQDSIGRLLPSSSCRACLPAVAAAIDHMDAALSKAVLTQVGAGVVG